MSSQLYDFGREGFLGSDIDWDADNFKVIAVDLADYTLDAGAHQHLDDIPAVARVHTSGVLVGKTITAGVADADNITLNNISGDEFEALVIFQDTGTEATSRLVCYMDTATGMPFTPAGADLDIQWDSGVNRIFTL